MTTAVSEIRWSRCTAVVVISYWCLYEGYYEEKKDFEERHHNAVETIADSIEF